MIATNTLLSDLKVGPLKACIIGSGNWGTAVGNLIAKNCAESYIFDSTVNIWVHEEIIQGRKLSTIINEDHVNIKYLPGVPLAYNLVANPNILEVVEDAHLLVFVMPHQFLQSVCQMLVGKTRKNAKAISLLKGIIVEDGKLQLCSAVIRSIVGIDCSVLSGANVAKDVAAGFFTETTIGYKDALSASVWQQLFDSPNFKVNCVPDPHGVELCGSIKNIIALSAGFSDGLGYGSNTKAAVMRLGVEELRAFAAMYYDGILDETFFDSAGYADVITTCLGGRNVRCAKEFVVRGGKDSWETIESDMLEGQKLQGHLACKDVYSVIAAHNLTDHFPLFVATYKIAFEGMDPSKLLAAFTTTSPRPIKRAEECNTCLMSADIMKARRVMKEHEEGSAAVSRL